MRLRLSITTSALFTVLTFSLTHCVKGGLIGTDVTLEANSASSQFPNFGPATETVVSPGAEFSFLFMSDSFGGDFGDVMVDAHVDFDSDSVTFSFVTSSDSLSAFGFPGQVFSISGLNWMGTGGEIENVTLLDNSLAPSIFGPAPDPVVTDIGPHSFNVQLSQFFTGPDGTTQSFTLGIEGAEQSAVPEPSSVALLGTGLLGLFGCGWRRKRRTAA